MNPLPDRTVILGLVATIGLVFALAFWTVRLNPAPERPMLWRDTPAPAPVRPAPQGSLL